MIRRLASRSTLVVITCVVAGAHLSLSGCSGSAKSANSDHAGSNADNVTSPNSANQSGPRRPRPRVPVGRTSPRFTVVQQKSSGVARSGFPAIEFHGHEVPGDCVATGRYTWSGPPTPVPQTEAASGSKILVLGDSLIQFANGFTRVMEKAGWSGTVDALNGRYIYDGIPEIRKLAATQAVPNVVLVALGTNGKRCPPDTRKHLIANMMSALGPDRTVIWVNATWDPNVFTHGPAPSMVNAPLVAATRRYRNLHLVDWASQSRRLIRNYGSIYQPDGVHLTTTGYRLRDAFICHQVATLTR